uniref:type I protein arginine methyltransferase n=1 Tax=Homalodisca liturata TaxID=320908 RepID=A0A1B6JFP7_9HEMI
MECYSYIKLVNFIRSTNTSCDTIMSCDRPLWSDDKYMTPVNQEDPWLMFDFDDVEESSMLLDSGDPPRSGYHVNAEDGRVTLSEMHFAELQKTIKNLNSQIKEKDEVISQLVADMQRMKATLGEVMVGESNHNVVLNQNVGGIRLEDDEEYFNTYAHFGIHHEMLSDEVRTTSYQNALCLNSNTIGGSTVLDLGCGTGILSMFAARAGAAQVIGIDQSDIIYHAMDIIRENNLSDKITLVKGRLEDTELPVPQVDVIVSEWMGYFLLFEAMLDSVIYARDKHLRPGGLLLPNRCSLSLVGGCDQVLHTEMLGFWSDVYGFKMSSLRGDVVREPQTCVVSPDNVATTPAQLCMLDLMTVTTDCMEFEADFQIVATKSTLLTCLVGYFDVFFDLPNPVTFSTSPMCKPTHWKQTVFLIQNPISVKQGEVIRGKLTCRRNRKELRSLIVTIILGNAKQRYLLS